MRAANILSLGMKELRSLVRDPIMLVLIIYSFTLAIYAGASAMPETLNRAPIAVIGAVLFAFALVRFRRAMGAMG